MYIHVCKNEKCKVCQKASCNCKQTIINVPRGMEYLCPYCGSVMLKITITTGSTTDTYFYGFK